MKQLLLAEGIRPAVREKLAGLARSTGVETVFVEKKELGRICDHAEHQGVVLLCENFPKSPLKNWRPLLSETEAKILICEEVKDPRNFGALVRSAKFHGFDAVLKLADRSCPLSATVSKSSAGALESMEILEEVNLQRSVRILKKEGFWIYGSDAEGDDLFAEIPPARYALIVGSEAEGLRTLTRRICDRVLAIPGNENFDSLNLSVAGGILMSHLVRNAVRASGKP